MRTFVAIDGGGTRSRLRVADQSGKILFEATGESTNFYSVGFETALDNLVSLIGSFPGDREDICIASAGLGREEEKSRLLNELKKHFPSSRFILCSDAEALIVGGLDSLEGAGLIAGTGSIAMRRFSDGRLLRRGGFGWRLGDEGSAWYLSDQAIRRTLRSLESRDIITKMAPSILKHFNVSRSQDLIPIFNSDSLTKATIASFAPTVIDFARNNDLLAIDIVNHAIEDLFNLVMSLFSESPCQDGFPLLLAGGVLEHNPDIRQNLTELFRSRGLEFDIILNTNRALDGALLLAKSIFSQS